VDSDTFRTAPEGVKARSDKLARNIEGTAAEAGEMVRDVGNRISGKMRDARTSLTEAQTAVADTAKQAADFTDDYVRTNPWKALGFAAGAGLLIGILLARR